VQEAARLVEVLRPAAPLPAAQVLEQRLGLRAGGGHGLALAGERRAVGLVRAPGLLQAVDGVRQRPALASAREQRFRDLERPRREAVPPRDGQREALADAMVAELEARRAGRRVDVEGGDVEGRGRERERLHVREV
jgi:hypothetical protein